MIADVSKAHRLAEALATRLCHDLSSPLNTLIGVADVVADDPDAAPALLREALGLVGEASQALAQRLRICRAAWGSAAALGGAAFAELAGSLASKRLDIDLSHLNQSAEFPAEAARLALNLVLLAVEALPRGGVIGLQGNAEDGLVIQIDGPNAAWPVGFLGLLADPAAAWDRLDDPALLQAPLTVLLAQHSALRISVLMGAAGSGAPALRLAWPAGPQATR